MKPKAPSVANQLELFVINIFRNTVQAEFAPKVRTLPHGLTEIHF
ncbi:hypothetical protein VII_000747 [Vibrio mimicus MB451]|nr:hypothetical protein VII_000747 [Vibrio mimicus MB451]